MAEKLGQFLLRSGAISPEQLNEALQCQVIFGGRLGTNLVELGYLTLEDLGQMLSKRSGFPIAPIEELEDLPEETIKSLPRAIVEKFKLIPIRIEAKTLHVAVCDPTDLKTVDEISFSTGMRVKPYLLPELRMYYLLEKHYGLKRDIRYIRLGRTLSRGKYAGAMKGPAYGTGPATIVDAPAPPPAAPPVSTEELESRGFRPLRAGEELTSEGSHDETAWAGSAAQSLPPPGQRPSLTVVPAPVAAPDTTPPASPAPEQDPVVLDETFLEPISEEPLPPEFPVPHPPPASQQEAAELRSYLQAADDREEVAGVALRLVRSHFAVAALFIVNKGMILGWKGAGGALDLQSIESLMLPASADSILSGPAVGTAFRGTVPRTGLNDRLLAGLGRTPPVNAVVVPVAVKNRVVNLFYADSGGDAPNAAARGYLELISRDVGQAYERIILAKKKNNADPA